MTALVDAAAALQADLVDLRRRLHRTPELGLQLPETQNLMLAAIAGLGLEITTYDDMSGAAAVLRGTAPGPVVLLRADMDALPISEQTGSDFAFDGPRMHACGHDLHTTMLVGAARLLAARRSELHGSVVFMFQPGEEGYFGARRMIEAGVLTAAGGLADAAYALHVVPALLRRGVVATRPGPLLASVDRLQVVVRGASGHGSRPHLAQDPIPVAAEIVTALHTAVTRQFDVFDPVVISVGALHAGSQHNVIADTASIDATMRSFSDTARAKLEVVTTRLCRNIAEGHGLDVDVAVEHLYPVTVNDADAAARFARIAGDLFGHDRVATFEHPLPGSEDFSFVLQEVPGAMAFLGACPPELDPATAPYNHSSRAVHDDAVLADGATLLAAMALDHLLVAEKTS
jgi:amidohydrolase